MQRLRASGREPARFVGVSVGPHAARVGCFDSSLRGDEQSGVKAALAEAGAPSVEKIGEFGARSLFRRLSRLFGAYGFAQC
jgi:hypothetical protein